MASFLDKMKIKTAVDSHVKLDLGSQHISTANFMQYNVAWSKELVPGEKISMKMETFARMEPLWAPTFGRANINTRAFFVPFRTIFPAWNDFITDTRHMFALSTTGEGLAGMVNTVPTVSNDVLVLTFTTSSNGLATKVTTNTFDFKTSGADGTYKFTAKGRQFYKQLCSLGYAINWTASDTTKYSALPLLALAKIYIDWYWPSQYINDERYADIDALCTYNTAFMNSGSVLYKLELTYAQVMKICNVIAVGVNYDSDYFVSAWDNPVNPNEGTYSDIQLKAHPGADSGSNNNLFTGAEGMPKYVESPGISQYGLTALRALTDYMKRHQLVGARALDRYLARFGFNLPAEKMNRSIYLGSHKQGLQFGDIMSTATTGDTQGQRLGDYSGKGISYGDGSFEYSTDEYGIMIIISSIVPRVGYYQGVDRNVMHIGKLDYYTPEFDNLGTQAITANELYTANNAYMMLEPEKLSNTVFGFTPRYAEYKTGKDRLTGDFRCATIDAGSTGWHMLREVEYTKSSDVVHNVGFVRGNDAGQYSRIFYNVNADSNDKMKVIYNFDVVSHSPMKSMFDTYEFKDRGEDVIEDVNGVKMN